MKKLLAVDFLALGLGVEAQLITVFNEMGKRGV